MISTHEFYIGCFSVKFISSASSYWNFNFLSNNFSGVRSDSEDGSLLLQMSFMASAFSWHFDVIVVSLDVPFGHMFFAV